MTKEIVFVFKIRSFSFSFYIDDLALNNVKLILGINMDADVLIEIHMKYDKLLILNLD